MQVKWRPLAGILLVSAGAAVFGLWWYVLTAPPEEPANPFQAPNPERSPWYEHTMRVLVYLDPWMIGWGIPIVGICALAGGIMLLAGRGDGRG